MDFEQPAGSLQLLVLCRELQLANFHLEKESSYLVLAKLKKLIGNKFPVRRWQVLDYVESLRLPSAEACGEPPAPGA